MTKRVYWNTDSFSKEVTKLTDGEYELLGEYEKTHTKTKFKHLKCGHEFEMAPHNFLTGQRCPYCRYKSRNAGGRKSYAQFRKEVQDLTNSEYDVLPPYKNNKTKVEFIHIKCGNHFMTRPDNFLNGGRCPKCSKKHRVELRTMTNSEFLSRVKHLWGNEYTVLSTYKNSDTLVKVKHNRCGNIYMTRPADFLRGHGCLKCSYIDRSPKIGINQRTPLSKVKESIKDILGSNYVVLTKDNEYKGNRQHILMKHLVCGHEYQVRYSDIQYNHTGCPYCASLGGPSNGELKILTILDKVFHLREKSEFYFGYVVSDLKDRNNLHFDFWIPEINTAIEYDGIQHFKPINYFGGIREFKTRRRHDLMKDRYCNDNNITLIRIPYTVTTNKEIKAILTKYLSGHR